MPNSGAVVLETRVVNGTGGGPDKTILNTPRFLEPWGYRTVCAYMHPPADLGFEQLRSRARAWQAPLLSIADSGPCDWRVVTRMLNICRPSNLPRPTYSSGGARRRSARLPEDLRVRSSCLGPQHLSHRRQRRISHNLKRLRRIDDSPRPRRLASQLEIRRAHPLVEFQRLPLEMILPAVRRPPRQPRLHRQIEKQRKIGRDTTRRDLIRPHPDGGGASGLGSRRLDQRTVCHRTRLASARP